MDLFIPALNDLLDSWLNEDLGRGDLTSPTLHGYSGSAHWITKKPGIFCGGRLVEQIFHRLDQRIKVHLLVEDGELIRVNQRLLELEGPAGPILAGERTSLNLSMRLSGIATETSSLVEKLQGTGVSLADTRKTTPGLRIFEKYAIRCGGGINHRMGLDDAAMLKENHLACVGGLKAAIRNVREAAPWTSRIIVEAETLEQAKEAVIEGADGVLLDEMSPESIHMLVPQLRQLAQRRDGKGASKQVVIEASGVDPKDLKKYATTGIDLISTSAPITRSSWLDFSMLFQQSHQAN